MRSDNEYDESPDATPNDCGSVKLKLERFATVLQLPITYGDNGLDAFVDVATNV
jgi:hypothetical protein